MDIGTKIIDRAKSSFIEAVCWEIRESLDADDIRALVEGEGAVFDMITRDKANMIIEASAADSVVPWTWERFQFLADKPDCADFAGWEGEEYPLGLSLAERISIDIEAYLRAELWDLNVDEDPDVEGTISDRAKAMKEAR